MNVASFSVTRWRSLLFAAVAIVLACLPVLAGEITPVKTPGNLVKNGSFDTIVNGVPEGWSGGPTLGSETTDAWHGHALRMQAPELATSVQAQSEPFRVTADVPYRLSYYFRLLGNCGISVQLVDAKGAVVHDFGHCGYPYFHGEWQFMQMEATPKAGFTNPCRLVLRSDGEHAGGLFDEVIFTESAQPHTGVFFSGTGYGKASARFSILNHKNGPRKVQFSFRLVNFFNEPVREEHGVVTLAPGEAIDRQYDFTTGDQTVFRGELWTKFDDGYEQKLASYYECPRALPGLRQEVNLTHEKWQFQGVNGDAPGADEEKWQNITLPHRWHKLDDVDEGWTWNPNKDRFGWYRLSFIAPHIPAGQRLILNFKLIGVSPVFYLNGKELGARVGSMGQQFDITDDLKTDSTNELRVKVGSWKTAFSKGPGDQETALIENTTDPGISDDVLLQFIPATHIERVRIVTSYRKKEIELQYRVQNHSGRSQVLTLQPVVYGEGTQALVLPVTPVYVADGTDQLVTLRMPWTHPHLYFPTDPYLYRLTTSLLNAKGQQIDRSDERFGFREFWTDGPDIKLNGRIYRGCSYQCTPTPNQENPNPMTRTTNWWVMNNYKHYGMDEGREFLGDPISTPLFRLDVADELGFFLRICPAGGLHTQSFFRNVDYDESPAYWASLYALAKDCVESVGNHPSIMSYTIDNENWVNPGERYNDRGMQEHYTDLNRYLHGLRPDILVEYDGGDPEGSADFANFHYPHTTAPRFWLPSAVWPPVPFPKDQVDIIDQYPGAYVRNNTKPLVLGEEFWDYWDESPQWFSILGGDAAYTFSPIAPFGLAPNDLCFNIIAQTYREAGMAYITTWGGRSNMVKTTLQPDSVFFKEFDQHFFSGEKVPRTAFICQDTTNNINALLSWRLLDANGKRLDGGDEIMELPAGAHRDYAFTVRLPRVTERTTYTLTLDLTSNDKTIATRAQQIDVEPRRALHEPQGLTVKLYDPAGATAKLFTSEGLPFTEVTELNAVSLTAGELLIIGQDALVDKPPLANYQAIWQAVSAGAKVLVLEQRGRVASWWPVEVTNEVGFYLPAAFPRTLNHPLLHGIQPADLMFWRGDNLVSQANWFKPFNGNVTPVLDAGNMGGLLTSPLLEIPQGKGSFLLCQMKVSEKLESEPTARQLLQNMLDYAMQPTFRPASGSLLVVAKPDSALALAVQACGIHHTTVASADLTAEGVAGATAILVDGREHALQDEATLLTQAMTNGKTVWLQGMTTDSAPSWQSVTGEAYLDKHESYNVTKMQDDALLNGLSNTDFYWPYSEAIYGQGDPAVIINIMKTRCIPHDPKTVRLLSEGALCTIAKGQGTLLIDEMLWPESLAQVPQRAPRIATQLALNLGVAVDNPTYQPLDETKLRFTPIALKSVTNIALRTDFPRGVRAFANIPIEIADGDNSALILGAKAQLTPQYAPQLKSRVDGISVASHADYLYFLATLYNPFKGGNGYASGESVGSFVIHYADGSSATQDLLQKVQLVNTGEMYGDLAGSRMVWAGDTPFVDSLDKFTRYEGKLWPQRDHPNHLYLIRWANPTPEKQIATIDFVSGDKMYLPILLGITAATRQ